MASNSHCLGAKSTADTTHLAFCLHVLALIMGSALYQVLRIVGNQLDQVSGTGSHALSAGHTFLLIHLGDAVDHMDGVKLAGGHTAAVAHTAVAAGLGAAARKHGGLAAVADARVLVLHLCLVAGALAADEGYILHPRLGGGS